MRTWTFSQIQFNNTFSLAFICCFLIGCKAIQTNPSILVIAVDHLGSSALDCSNEGLNNQTDISASRDSNSDSNSGFEILCRQFSRWTHTYTTSPLTLPALTSILTAEYPLVHGVHHNGSNYLPASFDTIAETAQKNGWMTMFISGGAPVLRKTGLSQGFEIFDDTIKPGFEYLIRPFRSGVQLYLSQVKELGRKPSFSVIYAPDLQFIKNQTKNNLGELRPLTYESQLEQFDQDLDYLFQQLKLQKVWDSTAIILAGLNAPNRSGLHPVLPLENLYSESTQVSLFIKWPNQNKQTISDLSVSLADVGATLNNWLSDAKKNSVSTDDFPTRSLGKLNFSASDWSNDSNLSTPPTRWIPIESFWAPWRNAGQAKWAFRSGPYLCTGAPVQTCFNSIAERDEQTPMRESDVKTTDLNPAIQKIIALSSNENKSFEALSPTTLAPFSVDNPCFHILKMNHPSGIELKKCEEPILADLLQWIQEDQNPQSEPNQKENAKKRFLRTYALVMLDQKIEQSNKEIGYLWDLSPERIYNRKILDAALALPEMLKYKQQAQRAGQEL